MPFFNHVAELVLQVLISVCHSALQAAFIAKTCQAFCPAPQARRRFIELG